MKLFDTSFMIGELDRMLFNFDSSYTLDLNRTSILAPNLSRKSYGCKIVQHPYEQQ